MNPKKQGFTLIELIVVIAIVLILASLAFKGCGSDEEGRHAWTESTAIIHVDNKYPIRDEGNTIYRIEATLDNGSLEVFEITDTLFDSQFNSADFFAKLKPQHKYEVLCRGFRSGRWSAFRNIIEIIKEVPIE